VRRWVLTSEIDITKLRGVVSGRIMGDVELSGSVLFVYYSRALRRWEWVIGGGRSEVIDEPQMLFLDEDWVRKNRNLSTSDKPIKLEKPTRIRRKKSSQMLLDF